MESLSGAPYEVQSYIEGLMYDHFDELSEEASDPKAEEEAIIARFVQEDEILHELADLAKRELEHIDSE